MWILDLGQKPPLKIQGVVGYGSRTAVVKNHAQQKRGRVRVLQKECCVRQ